MKELTITSVDVNSVGKLVGAWYAVVGFVAGVVGGVGSAVAIVTNNSYSTLSDVFIVVGVVLASIVFVPLVMFVLGWIHGAIIAFIFDVISGTTGGLKLKVDEASVSRR